MDLDSPATWAKVIVEKAVLFNRVMLMAMENLCCSPSFGLATKARACKGAGQEGSLRVTSYVPGSVGECEGTNPHIPR
jgi:hypothetical protein